MSMQGLRKELRDLKREHAPGFKTIEELLATPKENLCKLTDQELFRILQYYNPELTVEDLTTEFLQKMVDEGA